MAKVRGRLSPSLFPHRAAGVFVDAGDGLALAGGTFVVEHDAVVAEDFAKKFLTGGVACLVVLDIVEDIGIAGDDADFGINLVWAVRPLKLEAVGHFGHRQELEFRRLKIKIFPGLGAALVSKIEPTFQRTFGTFVGIFHRHVKACNITVSSKREVFLEFVVGIHIAIVSEKRRSKKESKDNGKMFHRS